MRLHNGTFLLRDHYVFSSDVITGLGSRSRSMSLPALAGVILYFLLARPTR